MVWESSIFTKWKVKVYKGTEYMNEDTERYEFDYGWEKWVNKKIFILQLSLEFYTYEGQSNDNP